MIGAVQVLALGYKQAELPKEIVNEINLLRSSDAVRLLDIYAINKGKDRTITEHAIEEINDWDGELIRKMLRSAGASRVLNTYTTDSTGFLVQGTPIPDIGVSVPDGTNVIVLLIEHVWASPLEDALRDGSAFPVAGGWAGRQALQNAGLVMNDTAD
ncbi:hypothetical protein GCM10009541_18960 [Micromonospora gifhornensis]|uniref:Uncharacterized protein n=1 Tax=Micromonospora gifhornensis TaxID=84594 RepID=A0ABQ4IG21_9ACTN|nr:hypothetical protein [Micromonospora gifhornensis]GIJ16857.1 hypothetical protein Vgi01_35410 [Micromonospora gifhornensis]